MIAKIEWQVFMYLRAMLGLFWVFAVAVPLLPGTAAAGFIDGQKLLMLCQSNRSAVLAYAAGAYDQAKYASERLLMLRQHIFEMPGLEIGHHDDLEKAVDHLVVDVGGYCMPENVSLAAVGEALCTYVSVNRSRLQKTGAEVVSAALKANWPCGSSALQPAAK